MKIRSPSLRRTLFAVMGLCVAVGASAFVLSTNPNNGLPNKWSPGPVRLSVLLGDTPGLSDGSSYNQNVATAAKAWNDVIGSVQFVTENSSGSPGQFNSINELAFASNVYGREVGPFVFSVTSRVAMNNRIAEVDVIFNSTHTWDSYRGNLQPGRMDIQRVALVALGHALGLRPTDPSEASIMNPSTPNRSELGDDDIQGAQALYGPPGAPANDNFANAAALILAANGTLFVKGYNTNATPEPGEPGHIYSGDDQPPNPTGRSVWWRWTAPSSASVTIDTRGSYFDTFLAVYTGSTLTALTRIAASNDIEAGVVQTSSVTFAATAGTVYHIAVDGFNVVNGSGSDSGGLTLNLAFAGDLGAPPTITTHPASATVTSGAGVSFSVVATGTAPLSYQWSLGGTAISGATSATHSIASATSALAGTYSVTVSNAAGSVTSNNATLTVNAPAPTPAPSSGGGGGGGAPSTWFVAALAALGLARACTRRRSGKM